MPHKPYNGDISDKTDIKIFILFLLDKIGYPLDDETLSEIIHESGYIGYYDFAECFGELTDAGHIIFADLEGKKYYSISELGHAVASQLQDALTAPIREKSLSVAMRILSFKKKNARPSAEVTASFENKYSVRCRITEPMGDIIDVTLITDTKEKAEQIKLNFIEHPEDVYRGMVAVLSGDIKKYLL